MRNKDKNSTERKRVETVISYNIIDAPPRKEFNDLARLLALTCDVSTALISFIGKDKQYFKGSYGSDLKDKPLESYLLETLTSHQEELTIFNLTKVARKKLSLNSKDINFFASFPLTNSDGVLLGSISLLDSEEKELNQTQNESIKLIAKQIIELVELHKASVVLQDEQREYQQEKDSFFDDVIELGQLGTWEWNMKTNEARFNDRWAEMLGYKLSEIEPITFQTWVDLLHPDDMTSASELVNQLENENIYLNREFRLRTKDGYYKWIRSRGKVIKKDKNGKPVLSFGINEDIHQEKITEIHLERINANLPAAVFRYVLYENGEDKFLYHTKKLNQIYDLPENMSLEGENINKIWSRIHPDDLPIVKEAIMRSKKDLSEFRAEWRIIRDDDSIKWLGAHGTIGHQDELATMWDTALFDITEEKKSSLAIKLVNRRLAHTQRIAKIGYWKYNVDRETLLWSDEIYTIFELDPAKTKLTFELFQSYVHPADKHLFLSKDYLRNNKVSNIECRIILPDNRLKWLKVMLGFETFNSFGDRINEGVIQDITKEKVLLRSIEESNQRFKLATRATSAIIWDWNIGTDQIVFGENFKEILDESFNNETMSSQTFIDNYIHGNDKKRVIKGLNASLKGKDDFWDCEFRIKVNGGKYLNVYDKAIILRNKKGEAIRMVGAMNNITRVKEHHRKLKQLNKKLNLKSKELQQSNSDLEQFAYVASHDLQEPLRMITGFLTLLEKKYNDKLDEKAKTYIFYAVDGAKRMRRIILDLLDYSRAGRHDRKLTTIDLNELVDDVLTLNNRTISKTKALINVGELPTINSHYSEVSQVFNNLINNALKYQNQGNIPEITISSNDLDTHWAFSIQDNGIGIDPKYFEQVFVIFKRLHTKEAFSGTGIGLAITKKIINALGGDIKISKSGKEGTIITFTIKKIRK